MDVKTKQQSKPPLEKVESLLWWYESKADGEVKLTFLVPGLQAEKKSFGRKTRKDPNVCLTYFKGGLSLEVVAEVQQKDPKTKKDTLVKYKHVIRRFPSAVDINRCEYEVMDGKVEVLLRKKDVSFDWQPLMKRRGLDQLNSREPSPEDDAVGGGAVAKVEPDTLTLSELVYGMFPVVHKIDLPDPDRPGERQITQVQSTLPNKKMPGESSAEEGREGHGTRSRMVATLTAMKQPTDDDDDDD